MTRNGALLSLRQLRVHQWLQLARGGPRTRAVGQAVYLASPTAVTSAAGRCRPPAVAWRRLPAALEALVDTAWLRRHDPGARGRF